MPQRHAPIESGQVRLAIPDGWEPLATTDSNALVLTREDPDPLFHTNLVVADYPWEGSIAELSATQLERSAAIGEIPVHTLDVADIEWQGHPARYHCQAYPLNGFTVAVDRVLAVAPGRALDATLSVPLRESLLQPLLLAQLLDGVEWDTPPGETPPSPRERLGDLPAALPAGGWAIRPAAADLLRELDIEHRTWVDDPADVTEDLAAVGAADEDGNLDDALVEILTLLRFPDLRVAGTIRHGERRSTLEVGATPAGVAVVSGPALHQMWPSPEAVRAEAQWFRRVNHGEFPLVLADWLGLGPSWGVPASILDLPLEQVAARLTDGPHSPAPASLDDDGAAAWSEPWTAWEIRFGGEGNLTVAGIRLGRFGHLRTDTTVDGEARSPRPGDIFTSLPALWAIQLDNTFGAFPITQSET